MALNASTVIVEAVREKMQSLIDTFSLQLTDVDKEIEEVVKQDKACTQGVPDLLLCGKPFQAWGR